jgi:hypothetical protein
MGMSRAQPKGNPKSRSRSNNSGTDEIAELAAELVWASAHDRPSILLAVTDTEEARRRAVRRLASRLRAEGLSVHTLSAARVAGQDIPQAVRNKAKEASRIFFIHSLERGGENALRALNLRREYFTASRARVVLWLTPQEERTLARRATDFWSIRHRSVRLA